MARNQYSAVLPWDRFIAKVWAEDGLSCWLWLGHRDKDGYGTFWHKGTTMRAHRVAYEFMVGPIADGLVVDHLCRKAACVNPEHLEPVTPWVNTDRGENFYALNRRKTLCRRGHRFDYHNGKQRICKKCCCENAKRHYWRKNVAT